MLKHYRVSQCSGAAAGQEKIWQKAFAHFNVSAAELQDWFAGPGFLAWQRMGNLQGWGGPLPQSYIDAQAGKVSHAHLSHHEILQYFNMYVCGPFESHSASPLLLSKHSASPLASCRGACCCSQTLLKVPPGSQSQACSSLGAPLRVCLRAL